MSKFFISVLLIFVFTSQTVNAAIYKGQKEFVSKCVKCHKSGQIFVATKNRIIWKNLLKNNGEKLAEIHLRNSEEQAEKSHEYFKSDKFMDRSRDLTQFLMEYAKDSGNVPACN